VHDATKLSAIVAKRLSNRLARNSAMPPITFQTLPIKGMVRVIRLLSSDPSNDENRVYDHESSLDSLLRHGKEGWMNAKPLQSSTDYDGSLFDGIRHLNCIQELICVRSAVHSCLQSCGLNTRLFDGGLVESLDAGRIGRGTKLPPQFGQRPPSRFSTHSRQKVHSKEQIIASTAAGVNTLSQHSQLGRNSSILILHGDFDSQLRTLSQCLPIE
jgi:hypothetical protein